MWEWHGMGGGSMWFFWIILIVLAVWAVGAVTKNGSGGSSDEKSPMEILRERYAKGEINQEEYEQKRKDLNG